MIWRVALIIALGRIVFKWKVKLHEPPLRLLPYCESELPSQYSGLGALPEAAGLPFFSSRRKGMGQGAVESRGQQDISISRKAKKPPQ